MSDLILPGDPPPAAYRHRIAELETALAQARDAIRQMSLVIGAAVRQFGIEDVLILGPGPRGNIRFSIKTLPDGDTRVSLIVLPAHDPVNSSPNHDGHHDA